MIICTLRTVPELFPCIIWQTGQIVATENIPVKSGFGTTAQGAGWDAFGKRINLTVDKTRNVIGKIK